MAAPADAGPAGGGRPGARAARRGGLGPLAATALVMGNVIGVGVFQLPAAVAGYGTVGILAFAVVSVCSLLLAVVFGWLGQRMPHTGGPYVYAREAFGELAGFLTAWSYWITAWASNAALVVAWAGYVNVLVPLRGTGPALAVTVGALWLAVVCNLAGARGAGAVAVVTTVLKFVPLVLVAVVGLFFVRADNFGPFTTGQGGSAVGALTAAGAVLMFSFLGVESAAVAAGEVENPRRTIMRATVAGTLAAALVYLLGTVAVFGLVPHERLVHSTAPYADAVRAIFGGGEAAGTLMAAAAVVSGAGTLVGWTLISAQMPYAAARDGLFPAVFARRNGRGVPWIGVVASGALASLITLANYTGGLRAAFTALALLTTFTAAIPYVFSAAAQLLWLLTDREPRGTPVAPARLGRDLAVTLVAMAFTFWLVAGAGYAAVYQGVLLLLAGIPVYVWMRWHGARNGMGNGAVDASGETKPQVR
ncbi:amino acid permease [Actinomadura kijaniata]|uniref:APA family basic amino acid/polyamine antiporter n=1 Tax=Actinomadura namibiensis TaxID=182080 RepID=A0A7W3QQ44_ACTNM|nr:amino acid permease [Actinomadura namibiensis]MBA8955256.1 APA family basic amino acid/polyamine antiporter [Actinomadura namibiensis]